jgi:hypothetical protein
MKFLADEFWWLEALGHEIVGRVEVARSWWTSPTEVPGWSEERDAIAVEDLGDWAGKFGWEGVHRSLRVDDVGGTGESLHGPFLVDIDANEDHLDDHARPAESQLEHAREIAVRVVDHYTGRGVPPAHRRLYFSGHKGFHVEVVFPGRPDMHRSVVRWRSELRMLRELLGVPSETDGVPARIDLPHCHKRINGSMNRWGPAGHESRYGLVRITEATLRDASIREFWKLAEA